MKQRLLSCGSCLHKPTVILFALVCGTALIIRCLHLLDANHYYILSPDSHFFNVMARLVATGQSYSLERPNGEILTLPVFLQSGVAYPLGLITRAFASITGVSTSDCLEFCGKVLPLGIAFVTLSVTWWTLSKMYGRSVAFFGVFAFAILQHAALVQAAGYLDRDGLNVLLVMVGALAFYFARDLRVNVRNHDLGWVIAAVLVIASEVLLFVEWSFLGPAILVAILLGFIAMATLLNMSNGLMGVLRAESDVLAMPAAAVKQGLKDMGHTLRDRTWIPLYVVVLLNITAGLVLGLGPGMLQYATDVVRGSLTGSQAIAELRGIDLNDILAFGPLVVAACIGVYVLVRRRRQPDVFWLSWFLAMLIASLFAKRFLLYAAPAVCVLSGLGLWAMVDSVHPVLSRRALVEALHDFGPFLRLLRVIAAFMLLLWSVYFGVVNAYNWGGSGRMVSVDREYYRGLTWLRDNTPPGSRIMAWWDYGYWVFDVADRPPVVDNGWHPDDVDKDIAHLYCTEDDSQAASIMRKYGATHLIVCSYDIDILPIISSLAELGNVSFHGANVPAELQDSLFNRAISGRTDFGSGLTRVYPNHDAVDPFVVIIEYAE